MVSRIRFLTCGSGALDRKTPEPHFVRSFEGMCIAVIEDRAASNMAVCEGRPTTRIHTCMLSIAANLAAALVHDLPSEVRTIVEAHFLDGESILKIQRQRKMKRRTWKSAFAPCSWMFQESKVERYEHQDDSNIHCQPFPESVSEEHDIYTDYDGYHRQHVKHYSYLSAHFDQDKADRTAVS